MTSIRLLAADDLTKAADWLAQPDVNKWLTPEWREKPATPTIVAIAIRNKRNRLFMIEHENVPVGIVALAELDTTDRNAMLWYLLGEKHLAGKGIITAAVRLLIRKAFDDLKLAVLYAWVMEHNEASRRVLERTGFRLCGRIRSSARFGDNQVSRLYFDLEPDDIQPLPHKASTSHNRA